MRSIKITGRAQAIENAHPARPQGNAGAEFGHAQMVPGLAAALTADRSSAKRKSHNHREHLQDQRRIIDAPPKEAGEICGAVRAVRGCAE